MAAVNYWTTSWLAYKIARLDLFISDGFELCNEWRRYVIYG